MSQGAIQYANDKVRGDVPAQKELMKLENVLIKHNNSSPNLTKAGNTSAIGQRTPKEENGILATGR
jgi:hypothetical protein